MTDLAAKVDDLLTDDMLERFRERAAGNDKNNTFFHEDLDDMKASGYTRAVVPVEFGGYGLSMAECHQFQRKIGAVAPPTALGINMHFFCTGLLADLWRAGVKEVEWALEEAGQGKIFAVQYSEAGNDLIVFNTLSSAERADGGWRISGRKSFGSLSPVWDYLLTCGQDDSDPTNPQIVHGFLKRGEPGYEIVEVWDTFGMRATKSEDNVMDGAWIPDDRVLQICPPGIAAAGPFHIVVYAWGILGFAAVYLGLAKGVYDMTVASLANKQVKTLAKPMGHHPTVQHYVADMRLKLEMIEPYLDKLVEDWSNGVDHGANWAVKILAGKHNVNKIAFEVVDTAVDIIGGGAVANKNPISRMFRDARCGRIHPASLIMTYEIMGKMCFGLNPDDRTWG